MTFPRIFWPTGPHAGLRAPVRAGVAAPALLPLFVLSLLWLLAALVPVRAAAQAQNALPRAPAISAAPVSPAMPQPPEVAARAFVLQDLGSGQTLAARQADTAVEPASLTKLMSAYLVFQAVQGGKLQLTQSLPISERAWRTGMTGASRTFVKVGAHVKVDDLIKGMIVQSGNDATIALAEGVGGSVENFVAMMNRQAQAFGLKATSFRNPEGLSAAGHASTARELSVIAARLITDFPQSLPYYAMKEFSYNGIRQTNRNLLLWRDPTVDGLKTGFTEAAGYCVIATAKRPLPGGGQRRLVSVVVGATSPESRANESQKLLNWGYSAFDVVKLFDAGQAVSRAPVWKGDTRDVPIGRADPLVLVVPRGQVGSIKTSVVRNDPLMAPLVQGQVVGTLKVSVGGQPWQEVPLQALRAVPGAGWFGRTWDALRLAIQ